METNTILLKVEDYNRLRDFEKEIKEGKIFVELNCYTRYHHSTEHFYTKDNAIKRCKYINETLSNEINDIRTENEILKQKLKDINLPKEKTIEEIKQMTTREFKKWKRGEI